jgi:hypothetical protein
MAKTHPITEHSQHFVRVMKEDFWSDVHAETKLTPVTQAA